MSVKNLETAKTVLGQDLGGIPLPQTSWHLSNYVQKPAILGNGQKGDPFARMHLLLIVSRQRRLSGTEWVEWMVTTILSQSPCC